MSAYLAALAEKPDYERALALARRLRGEVSEAREPAAAGREAAAAGALAARQPGRGGGRGGATRGRGARSRPTSTTSRRASSRPPLAQQAAGKTEAAAAGKRAALLLSERALAAPTTAELLAGRAPAAAIDGGVAARGARRARAGARALSRRPAGRARRRLGARRRGAHPRGAGEGGRGARALGRDRRARRPASRVGWRRTISRRACRSRSAIRRAPARCCARCRPTCWSTPTPRRPRRSRRCCAPVRRERAREASHERPTVAQALRRAVLRARDLELHEAARALRRIRASSSWGNGSTGTWNLLLGPLAGLFLAVYGAGVLRLRAYALPMSRIYAAYVIVNLILFTIRMPDEALGKPIFGLVYSVIAIGVSSGCAYVLARNAPCSPDRGRDGRRQSA